jgi:hypothetical protein
MAKDTAVPWQAAALAAIDKRIYRITSVLDPGPSDPYVFGLLDPDPLDHQAKIGRKTLIPTVF